MISETLGLVSRCQLPGDGPFWLGDAWNISDVVGGNLSAVFANFTVDPY